MGIAEKFRLDGKVALVTGASSGLGAHFAGVLAAQGARVAIAARRVDRLDALAKTIGNAHAVEMDVTDAASVEAALTDINKALGRIDILINNAGVAAPADFLDTTEAQWSYQMSVNVDAVARVGRVTARAMVANGGGGAIVNTASVAGFLVSRAMSAYAVSKAAVVQLTKAMALELAPHRIRVNALAPGYFPSELTQNFLASDAGKKMLARFPMQRSGRLEELDGALLLLASEAGSYMTGSVITVDGGTLLTGG